MNVLTGVNYIIIKIKIQDIYFLTLTLLMVVWSLSFKHKEVFFFIIKLLPIKTCQYKIISLMQH